MIWKNLKKKLTVINNRLSHIKIVRSTIPTGIHSAKKIKFAVIIILSVIFLTAIIENFSSNKSVVQANSIQGIGVGIYWDQDCTNRTLSLNWGSTIAGSSSNLTVYVRNEGNSAVSLRLNASEWIPSNTSSYMSLNWNCTSQVLSVDEVIPVELTLTVSPAIFDITNFSFDVIITTIDK